MKEIFNTSICHARIKHTRLCNEIRRSLSLLKIHYRRALSERRKSSAQKLLLDCYYLLYSEGIICLKDLKSFPRLLSIDKKHTCIYLMCKKLIDSGKILSEQMLDSSIKYVQQIRYLENYELCSLKLMLTAAIICDAARACERFDSDEAAQRLSICAENLYAIKKVDFEQLRKQNSIVEQVLLCDPAGIYAKTDEQSRALYCELISRAALKKQQSEQIYAQKLLENAKLNTGIKRHIGYRLLNDEQNRRRKKGGTSLLMQIALPLLLAIVISIQLRAVYVFPLIFLPLWQIFRPAIMHFSQKHACPQYLPRLELDGIPDDGKTLAALSTLLPKAEKSEELYKKLKSLYFKNPSDNINFIALADLKESKTQFCDTDKSDIEAAKRQIERLNSEIGDRFLLLVRRREYCATQKKFVPWERKRGALTQLIELIKESEQKPVNLAESDEHIFENGCILAGDIKLLKNTKYIAALDYDTDTGIDGIKSLIGCALHPINRPVIDKASKTVVRGYGIIAPRSCTELDDSGSLFTQVMAGTGGTGSYNTLSGDYYMDLFGEGIFCGKGLINVDAYYALMREMPEQKILSHDSIESGILRCAAASDTEFTDSFPDNAVGFLKRSHRWIRGDFQNIPFIFGGRNALNGVTKFKLLDNIRRPLTDIMCAFCLIVSAFAPYAVSAWLCVLSILAVCADYLFSSFMALLHNADDIFTRRFYTGAISTFVSGIRSAAVSIVLLPLNAAVSLDASARALFRRFISGKKLLEWTTAAASQKSYLSILPQLIVSYVLSVFLIVFAPFALPKLIGAVMLLSLPLMLLCDKKKSHDIVLSQNDKAFLLSNMRLMQRYFETLCDGSTSFLPPDNIQLAPIEKTAYRTSPTNIGFMLLSQMAFCDVGLISPSGMIKRLSDTLSTVERLERYCGNLFNWYDIKTLQPLSRFVSSVDSGNFVCCLETLSSGLKEYAQNNTELKAEINSLLSHIERIIEQTDLSVFYDESRRLFSIGLDSETGKKLNSHYDLYMSEARLTSYYAIAKRMIPKKHWGMLGRSMSRLGRHYGAVSWGGGLFEYFMPILFLPCDAGSFSWEGLFYALYCQRKTAKGMPWGISESGFNAFDENLNYQYRSHGEKHLRLKQSGETAGVISPYSSMLTMQINPRAAISNLKRLQKQGVFGKYGFYEAIDYSDNAYPKTVRSFMAHHVGMSVIACANVLCENAFVRRFMSGNEMNAAQGLLKERMTQGAVTMNSAARYRKAARHHNGAAKSVIHKPSPVRPKMHILSNGGYSLHISECGDGFSTCEGLCVTRRSDDNLRRAQGVFAVIEGEGRPFSIARCPDYTDENTDEIERRTEFTDRYAAFYSQKGKIEAAMQAGVFSDSAGEMRKIIIANRSKTQRKLSVLLYFEPCLRPYEDDRSHPAYSRIFMTAQYHEAKSALTFCVRTREGQTQKFLAVGLNEPIAFEYECDRENILGIEGANGLFAKKPLSGKISPPDTACAMRINLTVKPRSRRQITLLMCLADTREQALNELSLRRENGDVQNSELAAGVFESGSLSRALCDRTLCNIYYPVCRRSNVNINDNALRRSDLWSMSISGDYPIMTLKTDRDDREQLLEAALEIHKRLMQSGMKTELVLINNGAGKTFDVIADEINTAVEKVSSPSLLGKRGGIFVIDTAYHQKEYIEFIEQNAACCLDYSEEKERAEDREYETVKIENARRCNDFEKNRQAEASGSKTLSVHGGVFADDRFEITQPPKRIWTNIISNSSFGTMASCYALGCTWAMNSRENKLTPWYNDPCHDNDGEMLLLNIDGRLFDMIRGAKAIFSPDCCRYEGEICGAEYSVEVRVPQKGMYKTISVRMKGNTENMRICYYAEPVLSVDRSTAAHLTFFREENTAYCRNPWNIINGAAFFSSDKGCTVWFDRAKLFSGDWDGLDKSKAAGGCIALTRDVDFSDSQFDMTFYIGFAKSQRAAKRLKELAMSIRSKAKNTTAQGVMRKKYETGDTALDYMLNTWVPHQIISARINGRIGFYQCSGAYGYRDQLQDSISLLPLDSNFARVQIFRCAAKQFLEGGVLHWWHELPKEDGGTKGVRTRCSDDMLWLVYAVCEYVKSTGDYDILMTELPYIDGEPLSENEQERYISVGKAGIRETLLMHCRRAADYLLSRTGEHGLPLFGNGDWNDGMNNVGAKGRGESVWLAFFASLTLRDFAEICNKYGSANDYLSISEQLKHDVDKYAWDGQWYLRGFFDNGTPLGSHKNRECRIDSICQSFAAFCGMPQQRVSSALDSCKKYLIDEQYGFVRLFYPPFVDSRPNPGYIMSYPAGIRENGGQYTHAACWLAMAFDKIGDSETAKSIIDIINSAKRCQNAQLAERFGAEPYSIPADIYSNENCPGRAGWSHYTGSAGWFYRAAIGYISNNG